MRRQASAVSVASRAGKLRGPGERAFTPGPHADLLASDRKASRPGMAIGLPDAPAWSSDPPARKRRPGETHAFPPARSPDPRTGLARDLSQVVTAEKCAPSHAHTVTKVASAKV